MTAATDRDAESTRIYSAMVTAGKPLTRDELHALSQCQCGIDALSERMRRWDRLGWIELAHVQQLRCGGRAKYWRALAPVEVVAERLAEITRVVERDRDARIAAWNGGEDRDISKPRRKHVAVEVVAWQGDFAKISSLAAMCGLGAKA